MTSKMIMDFVDKVIDGRNYFPDNKDKDAVRNEFMKDMLVVFAFIIGILFFAVLVGMAFFDLVARIGVL